MPATNPTQTIAVNSIAGRSITTSSSGSAATVAARYSASVER
jgi:hypothetical protein